MENQNINQNDEPKKVEVRTNNILKKTMAAKFSDFIIDHIEDGHMMFMVINTYHNVSPVEYTYCELNFVTFLCAVLMTLDIHAYDDTVFMRDHKGLSKNVDSYEIVNMLHSLKKINKFIDKDAHNNITICDQYDGITDNLIIYVNNNDKLLLLSYRNKLSKMIAEFREFKKLYLTNKNSPYLEDTDDSDDDDTYDSEDDTDNSNDTDDTNNTNNTDNANNNKNKKLSILTNMIDKYFGRD